MSNKQDKRIETLERELGEARAELRINRLLTLVNNETNNAMNKLALADRLREEMSRPGLVVAGAGALANAAGTVATEQAGMAGQIAKWEKEASTHVRNAVGTALELGALLGIIGPPAEQGEGREPGGELKLAE